MQNAVLFPGQGSQTKGMGAGLFEFFQVETKRANDILGYSISELCLDDSKGLLNLTQYTQPALYVVNCLAFLEWRRANEDTDAFFAGHSLGEYSALFAAGAIDFETGLILVKKRGELMASAQEGGMAAVLGCNAAEAHSILADNALDEIDLANINTEEQIIVSGPHSALARADSIFSGAGKRFLPINVSAAFHSRYMQAIAGEFESFISDISFSKLTAPVISNVTARPHDNDEISSSLVKQLYSPVQWLNSIRYLYTLGLQPSHFEELGPGKVLTRMLTKIPVENVHSKKTNPYLEKKTSGSLVASQFGSPSFCTRYSTKYAYGIGGLGSEVCTERMATAAVESGLMFFWGTAPYGETLSLSAISDPIKNAPNFGVSIHHNFRRPEKDNLSFSAIRKNQVRSIEAIGFTTPTKELVNFRLHGIDTLGSSEPTCSHHVTLKTSDAEVANLFMRPAPKNIVDALRKEGLISVEQANYALEIPLASEVCLDYTTSNDATKSLGEVLPYLRSIKDELRASISIKDLPNIGVSGAAGTPSDVAAIFVQGADFIMTDLLNQTAQSSDLNLRTRNHIRSLKSDDLLRIVDGENLELEQRCTTFRLSRSFVFKTTYLTEMWKELRQGERMNGQQVLQVERCLDKGFGEIKKEISSWLKDFHPEEMKRAEADGKYLIATIIRWFFHQAKFGYLKEESNSENSFIKVCPTQAAFNTWVKNKSSAHAGLDVLNIAELLMGGAESHLRAVLSTERVAREEAC